MKKRTVNSCKYVKNLTQMKATTIAYSTYHALHSKRPSGMDGLAKEFNWFSSLREYCEEIYSHTLIRKEKLEQWRSIPQDQKCCRSGCHQIQNCQMQSSAWRTGCRVLPFPTPSSTRSSLLLYPLCWTCTPSAHWQIEMSINWQSGDQNCCFLRYQSRRFSSGVTTWCRQITLQQAVPHEPRSSLSQLGTPSWQARATAAIVHTSNKTRAAILLVYQQTWQIS